MSALSVLRMFQLYSFLDRGRNKVILLYEISIHLYRFVVLPDLFCIHEYEGSRAERRSKWKPMMKSHNQLYKFAQQDAQDRVENFCKESSEFCPKLAPVNPAYLKILSETEDVLQAEDP